jgi:AraC-like DNA-binding protein
MQHPYWVIDYCFHAGEEYRVRGDWLPRRAQTAHLYPPDAEYSERVVGEPVTRRSAAMLFAVPVAGMFAGVVDAAHGYAEIEDPTREIGDLMRAAAEAGHLRGAAGFWEAQGVLCRVIGLCLNARRVSPGGPVLRHEGKTGEPTDLAGRVDAYIRERLPGRLSLAEIARAMKVSASALSHGYKRETGKAVMAAAIQMRLEMAKPLLLQGQRLKTVASSVGFSDAFHLSKQFKRVMGVSPREFVGRGDKGARRGA